MCVRGNQPPRPNDATRHTRPQLHIDTPQCTDCATTTPCINIHSLAHASDSHIVSQQTTKPSSFVTKRTLAECAASISTRARITDHLPRHVHRHESCLPRSPQRPPPLPTPQRELRRRAGWRTPRKAERSPHRRRLHPITAGSIIIIIIIWQRRPTAP